MGKRIIGAKNLLRFLGDLGDDFLFLDRYGAWKLSRYGSKTLNNWEDYFPSHVERSLGSLLREGCVERIETPEGVKVVITDKGKRQVLLFDLEKLRPKQENWDGKWRVIFFDVEEIKRKKRDDLRMYLKKMGWQKMQESVYVNPFDCEQELKYIREILDIPDGVKMGVLEKIENEGELREMFGV
ncbi:MAG: CRISPR-associated endonuclease Cas2 [Patescibacteria group bacterium]